MRFLLCLLAFCTVGAALAQRNPAKTSETARQAVEDFRQDVKEGRIRQAVARMQLSLLPTGSRQARAERDAYRLDELLKDRTIPNISRRDDRADLGPLVDPASGSELGELIMRRGADGKWIFDAQSVSLVKPTYDAMIQYEINQGAQSTPDGTIFTNPRAAMLSFVKEMQDENVDAATQLLDLTDTSGVVRKEEGRRVAGKLFDIINRTRFVSIDEVPTEPESDRWVFETYLDPQTREVVGSVALEKNKQGAWLFDAKTVQAVPAIWDAVQNREVVGGVEETIDQNVEFSQWLRDQFPKGWRYAVLGVELWQFVALAAIAVGSWFLAMLMRLTLWGYLTWRRRRRKDQMTHRLARATAAASSWLAGGILADRLLLLVGLETWPYSVASFVTRVVALGGGVWLGWCLWEWGCRKLFSTTGMGGRAENLLTPIAIRFGKVAIFIAGAITALALLGVNVTALIAGLGIGGALLALAAKDSVENVLGSFTILLEMPFAIGDWVIIGEVEGIVEDVNVRSTRVRTFDDALIVLPNRRMIDTPIENLGRRRYRRVKSTLAMDLETDPNLTITFVKKLREMIEAHEKTVPDRTTVYFNEYGDGVQNILMQCFIDTNNWDEELTYRQDIMSGVWHVAHEIGVRFGAPRQVLVHEKMRQQ